MSESVTLAQHGHMVVEFGGHGSVENPFNWNTAEWGNPTFAELVEGYGPDALEGLELDGWRVCYRTEEGPYRSGPVIGYIASESRVAPLLNTAEAAARLNVSVRRVQALIGAGRLSARKHGRDWLIDEAALAAVAERKPGHPPIRT